MSLNKELKNVSNSVDLTLYFIDLVVISGLNLPNVEKRIFDKSDAYCEASVGGVYAKTEVIQNDLNPVWKEGHMKFVLQEKPEKIVLVVMDENKHLRDVYIGKAQVKFSSLFESSEIFERDLNLSTKGSIRIKMKCHTSIKPRETETNLKLTKEKLPITDENGEGNPDAFIAKDKAILATAEKLAKKEQSHAEIDKGKYKDKDEMPHFH